MPVLTDEDVGIAPRTFSDADVGLVLSDEDVGLSAPKASLTARAENDFLRTQLSALQEKNEGGTLAKIFGVAEKIVQPIADLATLPQRILELPEQLAASLGKPTPYTAKAPLVSPEAAKAAVEFVTPGGAASEGTAGKAAQEFVAEMASGMTTPAMVGALVAGTKAPVPVGRLFQADMLSQVPASVAAIKDAETGKEQTKAALGAAANIGFPAIIEKHITPKAVIVERAKEVGPATAAVISKETGKEPSPAVLAPAPDTAPLATAASEIKPPISVESPTAIGPSVADVTPPIEKPLVGLGAATPAEFDLSPKTATGIKNATVDQERVTRGLPPAMQPARRSFGTVWDQAMAKIDAQPEYTNQLLAEMREKPRAMTDLEDATILHRQIELQNEYGKATRDLAQAFDDGRMEDVSSEKLRVAALSDQLLDLYNIGKAVGTETGRGLNARKMLAYEDFSLAKMELEKRAAKNGEQLTETERAEVVRLNQKIEQTQKTYDDYVATAEQRIAALEVERALAAVERQARQEPVLDPKASSLAERIVKSMEKQADDSRAYLRGKLFTVSPDVLFHLSRIGAAQIARGTLEFSRWSTAMLNEFGEKIRPHLQTVFDAANKYLDEKVTSDAGPRAAKTKRVMAKTDLNEQQAAVTENIKTKLDAGEADSLTPLVQKLARIFVERGVKERDALIDAVHAELVKIDPNITRRDTMDAISGYGKYSQLTKDQISVELRDLKGQMQQVAKLEDIEARKPPLKTGVERRTPTDEERKLIKQVNEAKRKFGVVVTDPATQLKSALASRKTYYQNQIADLEAQIASRQKFVKEKTPSPTDPELEVLKAKRKALKEEFDEIFEKPGLTEEQREMRAIELEKKRLEKQITEQERKLREGDIAAKGRPVNRPSNPEIEPLKQRRDALNKQLAEARKKPAAQKEADRIARRLEQLNKLIVAREAKIAAGDISPTSRQRVNRPLQPELEAARQRLDALNEQLAEMRKGPSRTPEEIALKTLKTRLANTIKTLEDKLARGDFTKKPKRTIQLDPEATQLHFKAAQAKAEWMRGLIKDQRARRTTAQKIGGAILDTGHLVRTLMTTAEFSAVGRQGGFFIGRPVQIAKGIPSMLRAFNSEQKAHAENLRIMARPNYSKYVRHKLYLAEHGVQLSKMEEAVMSRWADKIPGIAGFQRAFPAFLNRLRVEVFDVVEKTLKPTRENLDYLADFINVATGRGSIDGMQGALVNMNQAFFAPRWQISRFQLVTGQPFWGKKARAADWQAKRAVAKEYARFLIGAGAATGLLYMLMGDRDEGIESNPLSTSAGKVRVGNTRVEFLAGLQQATVFSAKMITGHRKTQKGKVVPLYSTKDRPLRFGQDDYAVELFTFLRQKLAPIPASYLDIRSGEDVVGKPVTVLPEGTSLEDLMKSEAGQSVTPITYQEIYKIMREQGIPEGTILSLLAIFGAGVQTYD